MKSSDSYFRAALAILDEHGVRALTIANLCEKLEVTKGSFYHHFEDWDFFVDRLLDHWEAEQTERIIDLSSLPGDPAARLATLLELASAVPHGAEAAFRCWSLNRARVAEAQRRVDAKRVEYTRVVLSALIGDLPRAQHLAKLSVALFVGLQQVQPRLNSNQFREALYDFFEGVLGEGVLGPVLDHRKTKQT